MVTLYSMYTPYMHRFQMGINKVISNRKMNIGITMPVVIEKKHAFPSNSIGCNTSTHS